MAVARVRHGDKGLWGFDFSLFLAQRNGGESWDPVLSLMSDAFYCPETSDLVLPGLTLPVREVEGGRGLHGLCLQPEHVPILCEEGA